MGGVAHRSSVAVPARPALPPSTGRPDACPDGARAGGGRRRNGPQTATAASPSGERRRPGRRSSGLAEDPVYLGAADRAGALRHPATGLADLDLAVEVTLLLALHAVAVVALSHGESPRSRGCLGVRAGRRCASTLPGRASTVTRAGRKRPPQPLPAGPAAHSLWTSLWSAWGRVGVSLCAAAGQR